MYFGRRNNVWTEAKNAVEKAMCYAYRDRKVNHPEAFKAVLNKVK